MTAKNVQTDLTSSIAIGLYYRHRYSIIAKTTAMLLIISYFSAFIAGWISHRIIECLDPSSRTESSTEFRAVFATIFLAAAVFVFAKINVSNTANLALYVEWLTRDRVIGLIMTAAFGYWARHDHVSEGKYFQKLTNWIGCALVGTSAVPAFQLSLAAVALVVLIFNLFPSLGERLDSFKAGDVELKFGQTSVARLEANQVLKASGTGRANAKVTFGAWVSFAEVHGKIIAPVTKLFFPNDQLIDKRLNYRQSVMNNYIRPVALHMECVESSAWRRSPIEGLIGNHALNWRLLATQDIDTSDRVNKFIHNLSNIQNLVYRLNDFINENNKACASELGIGRPHFNHLNYFNQRNETISAVKQFFGSTNSNFHDLYLISAIGDFIGSVHGQRDQVLFLSEFCKVTVNRPDRQPCSSGISTTTIDPAHLSFWLQLSRAQQDSQLDWPAEELIATARKALHVAEGISGTLLKKVDEPGGCSPAGDRKTVCDFLSYYEFQRFRALLNLFSTFLIVISREETIPPDLNTIWLNTYQEMQDILSVERSEVLPFRVSFGVALDSKARERWRLNPYLGSPGFGPIFRSNARFVLALGAILAAVGLPTTDQRAACRTAAYHADQVRTESDKIDFSAYGEEARLQFMELARVAPSSVKAACKSIQ